MRLEPFRSRGFSLLWIAGLISLTGDWLLSVALPIYIYRLTGSPAAVSAIVATNVAARLLFGALAGVYVDRWDRRRVLIWANVALTAALLPLLAVTSADRVWLACAVTFVVAVLAQLVSPAEHALLPRLVDPAELTAANSLNTLNNNLARLIGPALGGLAAVGLGLSGVVLLDAASFLVAAGLVALIRGSYRAEAKLSEPLARELRDGFVIVGRTPVLRALFTVLAVTSVGEGVMSSLFAVFVDRGLGGGPGELGALMSAQAVGGIAGGLGCAWLAARTSPVRMVGVGLVLFGAVDLVIFNYPRWATAIGPELALFVLVGIPGAVLIAGAMTLLQTEVADALRGRVFAVAGVLQAGGMLAGTGLAATLTDRVGVLTMLTIQGLGYVLAGIWFIASVRVEAPAGLATEVTGHDHALQ